MNLKVYKHLDPIVTLIILERTLFASYMAVPTLMGLMESISALYMRPWDLSLEQILLYLIDGRYPLGLLKPFLRQMLMAVDFLHAKTGLIHTGKY